MNSKRLLPILFSLLPIWATALERLDDAALAGVHGQDGLTVSLANGSIGIDEFSVEADAGTAQAGRFQVSNIQYSRMDTGGPWLEQQLDVASSGGEPRLRYTADLSRTRMTIGGLSPEAGRSFGEWVLQSPVEFRLVNQGFFDNSSTDAELFLKLTDAQLFYRQNWYYHANLTMNNLQFLWDMPGGTVALDTNGVRIAGDVDYQLTFDWLYKFDPDQDMTTVTANDRPLLHLGWDGKLYDAEVSLSGGGIWDGSEVAGAFDQSSRTQGMNLDLRWNYRKNQGDTWDPATHMSWRFGKAGGNDMRIEFTDWRNLRDSDGTRVPYGFEFPITLDVVPGGSPGPGGLCWNGQTHGSGCEGKMLEMTTGNVAGYNAEVNRTDADAFLFAMRDGNLLSYANQVRVDPAGASPESYYWGLTYTLPNINANIAMYPGGSESDPGGGSRNQGYLMDFLLMSQSSPGTSGGFDFDWERSSHFMIVDTCPDAGFGGCDREVNMGFGFVGADFLLGADDMRLWLRNTWNGQSFPFNYEGGIDLYSPRVRMQFRGLLAMAKVPDGAEIIPIAGSDLNLEGAANFRISPPASNDNYLAYSAALRLGTLTDTPEAVLASGQGSYYSIYEPGRPNVALSLTNLSGDMTLEEGRVSLYARNEKQAGSPPELLLENKIKIGASAATRMQDAHAGATLPGGAAGQLLRTDVYFGNDRLGEIVIPNGTLKSYISLMPKP